MNTNGQEKKSRESVLVTLANSGVDLNLIPADALSEIADAHVREIKLELDYRSACMYANSGAVHGVYVNNPSACMVAITTARNLGVETMTYIQKSYVVKGKPGIEAQLAIAILNRSGKIKGPIRYDFGPENKTCTAYAIDSETGEKVEYTVYKEEVYDSKSEPWRKNPRLMLCYRAASYLIRTIYPGVLSGLDIKEVMQDENKFSSKPDPKDITDVVEEIPDEIADLHTSEAPETFEEIKERVSQAASHFLTGEDLEEFQMRVNESDSMNKLKELESKLP